MMCAQWISDLERLIVETKLIARNIGDEFRARLARGVEKFLAGLVSAKVSFVFGSQKRRLVMIKPPGQFFRGRILEVDDRIFVAVEQREIEKVSRTMQQTAVVDFRFRMNAFFVEAREGCGRGDAVEAVTVIKQTKFHRLINSQKSQQRVDRMQ